MPPIFLNTKLNYKRDLSFDNPQSVRSVLAVGDPYIDSVILSLGFEDSFSDSSPLSNSFANTGALFSSDRKNGAKSGSFSQENTYVSYLLGDKLATSSYTIEAWVKIPGLMGNCGLLSFNPTSVPGLSTAGSVYFLYRYNGSIWNFNAGNNQFTENALLDWCHLAVVRNNTSTNGCSIFLNGLKQKDFTDANNYTQDYCAVGAYFSGLYCWNGLIDSLRITKGVARYTANFNPETDTYLNI